MSYLILLPFGAGAGLLAGLFGVGGGVLLVPLLMDYFASRGASPFPAQMALGTSQLVIVMMMVLATRKHYRAGRLDWSVVLPMAPGVVSGAIMGGVAASWLPEQVLRTGFAGLMTVMAARFIWGTRKRGAVEPEEASIHISTPLKLAYGVGIGLFAGFFGVGGGILAVPFFNRFLKLDIHRAMACSTGIVLFSAFFGASTYAVTGFVRDNPIEWTVGFISLPSALFCFIGSVVGIKLGVSGAQRLDRERLTIGFALFMLAVAARLVLK